MKEALGKDLLIFDNKGLTRVERIR